MKILIVEDEPDMLENMRQTLIIERYTVEWATDFSTASKKVSMYDYDCVLLDINLPDGNGIELLQLLKSLGKSDSVIIVSARDSLDDKLLGLENGADDYLSKPFHMAELHARVKAVLRRKYADGNKIMQVGNLKMDPENRSITVEGERIVLNRKEFDILLYLIINKSRLVTKAALAEHVWGDHIDQSDSLDFIYSQIKNLRKKLEKATLNIEAVYGIGYKLDLPS